MTEFSELTPRYVKAVKAQVFASSNPAQEALSLGWRLLNIWPEPSTTEFEVVSVESPPEGETVCDGPEFILGTPHDASCLRGVCRCIVQQHDKVVRRVRNARVVGWRSILSSGNGLYVGKPVRGGEDLTAVSSFVSGQEGFYASVSEDTTISLLHPNPLERESFAGEALFLSFIEPKDYGSFILRFIPRLLYARHLGLKPRVIVLAERTPWIIEALCLTGFGHLPTMTVNESFLFTFENLVVIDEINNGNAFVDPESQTRILKFADTVSKTSPTLKPNRIYVSRRMSGRMRPQYRCFSNELVIETAMIEMGFHAVCPELYAFSEQVALFANAESLVGPSGSGNLNSVFSRPGATIVDAACAALRVYLQALWLCFR